MVRVSTLAFLIAGVVLVDVRPADACGQPYDPSNDLPPCSLVQLWTPATKFPQQLEGSIRVGTFDRRGNSLSSQPTFDPNVQLFVHRLVAGSYVPVAFTLVNQTGLVTNARHLELADPVPGMYVVSSPQITCAADPSPVGNGLLVGSFEIAPAIPLPASLGALQWLGERSVDATVSVGPGSMCELTDVSTRVTHSTLELQLGVATRPWSDVIEKAVYVDGQLYWGFSKLAVADDGVATVELTRTCSSSLPREVPLEPGVGDGVHTVKLVGKIDDLIVIESNEVTFSLSCTIEDDDWIGGGCSTGGSNKLPLAAVFVVLIALTARRMRPRR